jgi:hypothetical protein
MMTSPEHSHRDSLDPTALFEQLVDLLADALAPRIADLLTVRQQPPTDCVPTRRLLTIDELVALLPAGKKPQTWRAWLYQHTRHDAVPGCHKIGGRLFFNPEETLAWILPATSADTAAALDLSTNQSLHDQAMPHKPTQPPGRGGNR